MPLAGMDDGTTCWGRMAPPRPLAGMERRRRELGQDGPTSFWEERVGGDGGPSSGATSRRGC
jgi:hypothetical protein